MPLFELGVNTSPELKAVHQLAERLSESAAFQQLAEVNTDEAALAKIQIGLTEDPFDGDSFSRMQLDDRHLFTHLRASEDEGHTVTLDEAVLGTPRQGGIFVLTIKRQVRESEDLRDAFLFFWDRVSAAHAEVISAAEQLGALTNRNRFNAVGRMAGPELGPRRAKGDCGEYLQVQMNYEWGDLVKQ